MSGLSPEMLRQLPLFKDMPDEYLPVAASLLTPRRAAKGEVLMKYDETGDDIMILLYGNVKVCVPGDNGELSVVAISGPGDVLGEMSVVDGQSRSASVIAIEDCGMFVVDGFDFWGTLWTLPPVPYNMVTIMNRRMRFLMGQMHALRHLTPPVRLARQLAFLMDELGLATANGLGIYLPFPLSIADLASLCGVHTEEAVAALGKWRSLGMVQTDTSGHFAVRSVATLRAFKG